MLLSVGFILFCVVSVNAMDGRSVRRVRRGWLAGGRPAGVPCAFDPCTINDFCGTGRTCEIDENCRHSCKCDTGSKHELCDVEDNIATTTATPKQCTFNLCNMPSACNGKRKCILDHLCHIQCECTSESTHESCVREDEPPPITDNIHSAIAECNRACKRGECVRSSDDVYCQCEDGWTGGFCDIQLGQCTLECTNGFKCSLSKNYTQVCVPSVSAAYTTGLATVVSTTRAPIYNICIEDPNRVVTTYQNCSVDVECLFGACIISEDSLECQCYPGATGPRCDIKCCLDCGANGYCSTGEDGIELCQCNNNFTGDNCSLPLNQANVGNVRTLTPSAYTNFVEICLGITYIFNAAFKADGMCDPAAESCFEPVTVNVVTDEQGDVSVKGCPGDIVCQHGFCIRQNKTGVICECDEGWGGKNCNESKWECTLHCPLGDICVVFDGGQENCIPVQDLTPASARMAYVQREKSVCNESSYDLPMSIGCDLPCVYGVCKMTDTGLMECQCDLGAVGDSCENKCCLDCNSHGDCEYDAIEDRAFCNCWVNYTGYHCEQLIRVTTLGPDVVFKETPWYPWVVGASVAVLVVLLLLLVVLPYVMWKRRLLLGLRIVHFFQKYEDDDDRQWDAFVSYKSGTPDEHFVVQTLIPKLEQELGFKLHLHFRDFIPGETIANNIVKAVLGSRRTILIVSPEFAQAEWTKFEYHIAQQEMLKRKHRIIPIVLEKITKEVDPILNTILEAVTYLEWPTNDLPKEVDKFWKRLELSMPKKRAVVHEQENGVESVAFNNSRNDDMEISIEIDNENTHTDDSIRNNHVDPEIIKDTNNMENRKNMDEKNSYGRNNCVYDGTL